MPLLSILSDHSHNLKPLFILNPATTYEISFLNSPYLPSQVTSPAVSQNESNDEGHEGHEDRG